MNIQIQLSKETLAERYATLKVQADRIAKQMREAADELVCMLADGESVKTPEYSVTKNIGRKVVFWTDAGKVHKKEFELELIRKGLMAEKMGESYVQVRFHKEADSE